jgi:transcriptional regulator with XRE-family HTH domain
MTKVRRLRKLREREKFSIREIANIAKVDPSFISLYERNKRGMSFAIADRIASFFNMPIEDIFPEFGRKSPYPEKIKVE